MDDVGEFGTAADDAHFAGLILTPHQNRVFSSLNVVEVNAVS